MNKLILVVLLIPLLASCAFPKNDNNEYELWVRMLVEVQDLNARCGVITDDAAKAEVHDLYTDAQVLRIYAQHVPANEGVFAAAEIIAGDTLQLRNHYETNSHNVTYCERKTDILAKKLEAFVKVLPTRK